MLKRNWSLTGVSLAAIIFYAVCGLLLLLLPSEALAIANYAIAALLLMMGVVCIIGYFRGSVIIGQFGFLLAVGMVLVTLAVVMFCYPTLLASLLPVIWGVSLLIGGFGKIQFAADLRRFGDRRWWTLLLGALQNAKQKGLSLTDDCSAVEALGMTVLLTDGSEENIKITTPLDLDIAGLILKRRQTP